MIGRHAVTHHAQVLHEDQLITASVVPIASPSYDAAARVATTLLSAWTSASPAATASAPEEYVEDRARIDN